jgi:hypothetical protein
MVLKITDYLLDLFEFAPCLGRQHAREPRPRHIDCPGDLCD